MFIPVILKNGYEELVNKEVFHSLMIAQQIMSFKRSDGWVVIGQDPLRDMQKDIVYSIPDRRNPTATGS